MKRFFFNPKLNLFDLFVFIILIPLVLNLLGGGAVAWLVAAVLFVVSLFVSIKVERSL